MRSGFRAILSFCAIGAAALAGCATYKETLTNAQGQTVTCEASGKSGIVTGFYLRKGFDDCVDRAKQAGYTDAPATPPK